MNGNFQNNHGGGRNDTPLNDFNQRQFNYNNKIPHDSGHHHADNRYPPHQMPEHFADNRYLPHQTPKHYADNRHLPLQTSEHHTDMRHLPCQPPLPRQPPEHHPDTRHLPRQPPLPRHPPLPPLPRQSPEHHTDMRHLPCQPPLPPGPRQPPLPPGPRQPPLPPGSRLPPLPPGPRHPPIPPLPRQLPEHHTDMRHLPRQPPLPPLPRPSPEHHTDMRHLSRQMAEHHNEMRHLPQQTLEPHVDKRHSPQQIPLQMSEHHIDKRHVPHKIPEDYADKRHLQQQTLDHHSDKSHLPHIKPKNSADKRHLPQQMPEHHIDKRDLPCKKPEDYADKTRLPQKTLEHHTDKRHLPQHTREHYTDNKNLMPEGNADNKCLPHKTPEPPIPAVVPVQYPLPNIHCKICDVTFPRKNLQQHNNGKRHRSRRLELREQSRKLKNSKKKERRQILNSQQMKSVVQLNDVPKCEKNGRPVENSSHEAPSLRHKEVSAEGSKRELKDNTGAKDRGFKVGKVSCEATSLKHKKVLTKRSKRKLRDDMDNGCKRNMVGTTGGKYMKMNNGIRKPMKSSEPEVNVLVEIPELTTPELTPPSSCEASPKMAPIPVEGSSFELQFQHVTASMIQESKGKQHHEFQNHDRETHDQPHPISMEFHAHASSNITTLIEGTGSDSAAVVIAPPQSPIASPSQLSAPATCVGPSFEPKSQQVLQTKMSEGKVHTEIQNHIVDSKDQQQSISMELHDPAGSITNTQTEFVNPDSMAIEIVIEPLAVALPHAVESSFEPLSEHDVYESQVLEAISSDESQRPTEDTDIQLLPSVLMEIDAPTEVTTATETADESSQTDLDMDVLANELGIIQLPQVSVCLKCGDEGFPEILVYCNKCQDFALHRYCLDGPVVFTDEVIWFCEDCEEDVVNTDYSDPCTLALPSGTSATADSSSKGEVDSIEKCSTVIDPQPIAVPIWRGSLQLFNKSNDSITKLLCHLSTLACPKVLMETRHLPNVLHADLLQRSAVWPKSFRKSGPTNESIGLYFFPHNERLERSFDQLVDQMITNDLAIRAGIKNADLLIFPSTVLPSQYKRFQSKYYLWGTFKRKQAPPKTN